MINDYLNKLIEKRSADLNAIKSLAKSATTVEDANRLYTQAEAIEAELTEARAQIVVVDDPATVRETAEQRGVKLPISGGTQIPEDAEKRGRDLKEGRSITVASSNLVVPKHVSSEIKEGFNEVAHSLIDGVDMVDFMGGDSYKIPYMAGYGLADYSGEGADYTMTDPTFGYSEMNKAKLSAYSEISREAEKLPNANYEQKVIQGCSIALRKKLGREILVGDGATGHITGIFNSSVITASPLAISAIDKETLDDIVYSYGGDEDVEGFATLILNKADLAAFAKLETAKGLKPYVIKNFGNFGFINEIPFVISSACSAISDSATVAGAKLMAYGNLKNYCLARFSDVEIEKSYEYRFKQGMTAYRGDLMCAGNVVLLNGFRVITKAA